jgi:hypothetical protein
MINHVSMHDSNPECTRMETGKENGKDRQTEHLSSRHAICRARYAVARPAAPLARV